MANDQKENFPAEAFLIERHPNLMCDELKEIYEKIYTDIIQFHRIPMKLFETLRNPIRQKMLFETGKSKTLNSRHLPNAANKSEAFDIVVFIDNKWSWNNKDLHYYQFLGDRVMEKFSDKISWGGMWSKFKDFPHYELK